MKNNLIENELAIINSELAQILEKNTNLKKTIGSFLIGSSKCIRSKIALLYLKAHDIIISKKSLNVLVAGEIIHNASLLHDDVIDEAETRRDKTSINKQYSPHLSIILGDYLLKFAIEKIIEIDNKEILEIFFKTTQCMCEAEIKQFFFRGKLPEFSDYIDICNGKTSSLFSAIVSSCSIIEELNKTEANLFANKFGILFQLKNDLNKTSREYDKKNLIYTAKDIIGLDKTIVLIDNYKKEILEIIEKLPNNEYRREIEDIVNLI